MPLTNIDEVFTNATVVDGDITIPSGDLISNTGPVDTQPDEIIFGMLETIHQGIVAGNPTNIRSTANSTLVSSDTYRRSYTFTVDLEFDGAEILGQLNVKAEPEA